MTATSAINAIQYPDLTDVKDQVAQFATLNTNVDTSIVPRCANTSDRNTRFSSPIEGQLAYLTQESVLTRYNGTAWVTAETNRIAYKSVNETITAASTAVNSDDALFFYAEANSTYKYDLVMFYSGNPSGDQIFGGWSGPTGATLVKLMMVPGTGQTNINAATIRMSNIGFGQSSQGGHNGAGYVTLWMEKGVVTTSSTPGLFQFNWSKPTAYSATLTVYASSFVTYTKIS